VIAAERNVTAARRFVAALTRLGRILVVPPIVIVEARHRAASVGAVNDILAQLRGEPHTPDDGRRASDLLREARRQAAAQRVNPSDRIHAIGTGDALVAAMAERLGGIGYTADPKHVEWLCDTGARITIQRVPDFLGIPDA
jgi:predicted nucleic acid-binding protein